MFSFWNMFYAEIEELDSHHSLSYKGLRKISCSLIQLGYKGIHIHLKDKMDFIELKLQFLQG